MMFGLAVAVKAEFIGMLHITAHFLEEALVKFRSLAGHSLFDFVPPPDDAGLHQMEFHSPLLTQSFLSTHALIGRVVPRCQWTICQSTIALTDCLRLRDRQSVGEGKGVSVRVNLGGSRFHKKNKQ